MQKCSLVQYSRRFSWGGSPVGTLLPTWLLLDLDVRVFALVIVISNEERL